MGQETLCIRDILSFLWAKECCLICSVLQEYDEVQAPRWIGAAEHILSSALTILLVAVPLLDPGLKPLVVPGLLLWFLLQLLASSKGSSSIFALCWSIHSTRGPYQMCASIWLLLLSSFLEAAFLLLTVGLGVIPSVACRIVTPGRQSVVETLLGLMPLREVVRPMHFSPMSVPRYSRD